MDELDALWAFLVAAAVAFGATPPVAARLARRVGASHQPRERDLHDKPVPRLGGLAILVAVVVAGVLFLPDDRTTRGDPDRRGGDRARRRAWTTARPAACRRS